MATLYPHNNLIKKIWLSDPSLTSGHMTKWRYEPGSPQFYAQARDAIPQLVESPDFSCSSSSLRKTPPIDAPNVTLNSCK